MTYRKKLIEVAIPLDAINAASSREKSIRHGHPSTLHLWWARRPLAACRAVLFAQLVDDPSSWPDLFPTVLTQKQERDRLFTIIEDLVKWENSSNIQVLGNARREIARSMARERVSGGAGDSRDDEALHRNDMDPEVVDEYLRDRAPPVHDPFAGGGSIPMEAQRLGLRAVGTDLNPVAVLINRALIEFPTRFSGLAPVGDVSLAKQTRFKTNESQPAAGFAEDIRRYGRLVNSIARDRIGDLYPQVTITQEMTAYRPDLEQYVGKTRKVIAWLWARTARCPNPGCMARFPLARSFALATKAGKGAYVKPEVNGTQYQFKVVRGEKSEAPPGTVARSGARCLFCSTPVPFAGLRQQGGDGQLGTRLMAVVVEGHRERIYLDPTADAEALANSREATLPPETRLPKKALGFRVQNYGMKTHRDLFSKRQLVAMCTFSDVIRSIQEEVERDASQSRQFPDDLRSLVEGGAGTRAYGEAIRSMLAFSLSRSADFWSTLCVWSSAPKNEVVMHVFGKQTLQMTWDYGEVNPFSDSSGNWTGATNWVSKVIGRSAPNVVEGMVAQADAAEGYEHAKKPIFSTDPPYYDNVPYADLSDYFYVWLRRTLRDVYPQDLGTMLVPKSAELIAEPARHAETDGAERFFLRGMTRAMSAMASRANEAFPITIYYAFKQSETTSGGTTSTGWETFLAAVFEAGLDIVGTWPVRTERPGRLRDTGSNALASSVVLVCRIRDSDQVCNRAKIHRELRRDLPAALTTLRSANIAAVDQSQAYIGLGMAIFSRYATILKSDDTPMSVGEALALVNEVVDEILAEDEGLLDSETRFAVTWFTSYGFDPGPFGEAEVVAKARAVAVRGVAGSGICVSGGGRVQLISRGDLPVNWSPDRDARPTVWEATQHMIKRLDEDGEEAASMLLGEVERSRVLGPMLESARLLAYRLYTICERKGRAEEASAYNRLVIAWPELARLAAQHKVPDEGTQEELF